ncbi:MAG: hypothetical protein ACKVOT_11905 [Polaromonas sp.]
MSFRSTEFIDDSARDNQATNSMEIKETGFAWGQIRDMQAWYQELTKPSGQLGAGQSFAVTGYSLGGHLATAFNTMYAAAKDTFTFNGAGIGGIERTTSLKTLIDRFTVLSANSDGQAFSFTDSGLSPDLEAKMVLNAIGRIDTIRAEVSRLDGITNSQGTPVTRVNDSSIGQESLDYQMAVLTLKPSTNAASLLNGTRQMIGDKEYVDPANRVSSQFDVVGDTSPSAVSNSQWHIGTDVRVFIEDQPLYRGSVLVAGYAGSFIVAQAFTTESIAACACNSKARRRFDPKNRVCKTMAFAARSAA